SATRARVEALEQGLAEASEQQAATSQVLEAIGRASSDVEPVFEIVARHARRLCAADAGLVYSLDGDVYRPAVVVGGSGAYRKFLEQYPVAAGPGSLVGLVGLEKRTVHIEDASSDPRYQWHEAQELGGFRTILGVPMLAKGRVVGVIVLWRRRVDPF